MQWFEESEELAQAAHFPDVTEPKAADLSWARPASPEPDSLRSPRVPSIQPDEAALAEPHVELEGTAGLSFVPNPSVELDARRIAQDFGLVEPEPRRTDTMIDDIVPRAEEEAFVAIREAVAQAASVRDAQFAEAEQRLVELALLVARRVIAREVSLDPGIVLGLVREGMTALGERDRVVVRVGTFYRDMREELQQKLSGTKLRCEVVVDPSLGRSGCIVETDLGRVDESIETRLENLVEAASSIAKRTGQR